MWCIFQKYTIFYHYNKAPVILQVTTSRFLVKCNHIRVNFFIFFLIQYFMAHMRIGDCGNIGKTCLFQRVHTVFGTFSYPVHGSSLPRIIRIGNVSFTSR